ncbi:hypothetical protein AB0M80_41530 [Amycolatopsis sp. NPDC051045]|uniref:terpene synthase family protein n=1 Tax=Amycolatopsis sp. NPDC051045 TaxID=3156922 RepID=UPI003448DDF3
MSHTRATAHQPTGGSPSDAIEVYCPVPLQIHPAGAEEVDTFAVDWLVNHGLFTDTTPVTRMNIGLLIAAAMPFTTTAFVKAFTTYCYWAFAWDDHLDHLAEEPATLIAHVGEVAHALQQPTAVPIADDLWVRTGRAVRELLFDCLSPTAQAEFRHTNLYWITGELWKRAIQIREHPPNVGNYLRMRWAKLGGPVLAAATGPGGGYPLSYQHLQEPLILAFTQTVLLSCGLLNDMGSSLKETTTQSHVNLMAALDHDHTLGGPAALAQTYQLYERALCLMPHLQQRLLADPRPEVARYASELPQWIPATVHFTATSARYHQHTAPALTIRTTPTLWDPTDLTPPPYPQISWWWNQLT